MAEFYPFITGAGFERGEIVKCHNNREENTSEHAEEKNKQKQQPPTTCLFLRIAFQSAI